MSFKGVRGLQLLVMMIMMCAILNKTEYNNILTAT